jgi:hypothetical protein
MKLGDQQCGSFLKERRLWKRESASPTLPHLLEGRDPSFPTLQSFLPSLNDLKLSKIELGCCILVVTWIRHDSNTKGDYQWIHGTWFITNMDYNLQSYCYSQRYTSSLPTQYYGHVLWGAHYSTKWSLHLDGWRSSSIGGSTPLTVSYHSNFWRLKIGFSWLLRIHQPFHDTRDFFNFYESKEFRLASLTSIVNRVWSVNS